MGPDVLDATVELTPISKFSKYMAAPRCFNCPPTWWVAVWAGIKTSRVLLLFLSKDLCWFSFYSSPGENSENDAFLTTFGNALMENQQALGCFHLEMQNLLFSSTHQNAHTWPPQGLSHAHCWLGKFTTTIMADPRCRGLPFFHTLARLTTSFEVTEPSTDWTRLAIKATQSWCRKVLGGSCAVLPLKLCKCTFPIEVGVWWWFSHHQMARGGKAWGTSDPLDVSWWPPFSETVVLVAATTKKGKRGPCLEWWMNLAVALYLLWNYFNIKRSVVWRFPGSSFVVIFIFFLLSLSHVSFWMLVGPWRKLLGWNQIIFLRFYSVVFGPHRPSPSAGIAGTAFSSIP